MTGSAVTGDALDADGIWRQHSWLLRKHPGPHQRRLIETTVRQVRYFGVVLDDRVAEAFYQANGDERLPAPSERPAGARSSARESRKTGIARFSASPSAVPSCRSANTWTLQLNEDEMGTALSIDGYRGSIHR